MSNGQIIVGILSALLLVLSAFGWGILSLISLNRLFSEPVQKQSFAVVAVLGAAFMSIAFFALYLVAAPLGHMAVLVTYTGVAVAAYASFSKAQFQIERPSVWSIITFAPIVMVLLLASVHSPIIHPDAQQYHLAFPWHMLSGGTPLQNETYLHSGVYLGFDILYLGLGDLQQLQSQPNLLIGFSLFNAFASTLLIAGTLTLALQLGANRAYAILAALSVFSMSAILYWGLGKNDLVAAGSGLLALSALHRAWVSRSERDFFVAALLGGFAVAIKISSLPILAIPFLYCLAFQPHVGRRVVLLLLAGCCTIFPWMIFAALVQGNPFHPLFSQLPAEVSQAWSIRNANGLERSFSDAVTHFFPILLSTYKISGNQSLGLPFVLCFPVVLALLATRAITRRFGMADIIALSGVLWFCVFFYERFDGRFLSRYIVVCGGIFFAYVAALIHRTFEKKPQQSFLISAFLSVVVLWSVGAATSTKIHLRDAKHVWANAGSTWRNSYMSELEGWTALNSQIANLRSESNRQGVAVNDHFILFVKDPVYNIHAMHAASLNLYEKDYRFMDDFFSERDIGLLVIRPDISGMTEALVDFIAHCTDGPIAGAGNTPKQIYLVVPCKQAGRTS